MVGTLRSRRYEKVKPYLYLLPAFFFLFIFTYYPIFRAVYISFFNWSTDYPVKVFNGIKNYLDVLENKVFWHVIRNTILYSFSTIFISMSLGLFLAVQVNKNVRGGGFFKVALFYPMMIPGAAAALIWLWMYVPTYGVLDYLLSGIGLRG
ncbi:unnamed protein product, partial [marine sediment metagenome]